MYNYKQSFHKSQHEISNLSTYNNSQASLLEYQVFLKHFEMI